MYTLNTPIHISLWNRDFWLLSLANFLLSFSIFLTFPSLPLWMEDTGKYAMWEIGTVMLSFAPALFLLGGFCSYLVQQYRRNHVCQLLILLMAASHGALYLFHNQLIFPLIILSRVMLGAFYGLAEMILMSTLIIDTCASFRRTEANHCSAWFSRFGLALGPLCGLLLYRYYDMSWVYISSALCGVLAVVLIIFVRFPFRAPEEIVRRYSTDRFLLLRSWPLFVNLLMMAVVIGLFLPLHHTPFFYLLMAAGFVVAIAAQRFVFREADLRSEAITSFLLILAALLIELFGKKTPLQPLFVGLAVGILGARFLLFFIKLSKHCERGTSCSTFVLSWESGITLGIGGAYLLFGLHSLPILLTSLLLAALSLLLYMLFTHRWFIEHKNR